MQVSVTFRHLDPSDSLKDFAREKVERVQKFLDQSGEAQVILSIEKHMHHAEVLLHAGPFFLRSKEKSSDMYASIGLAIDKVERQAKRYKERMRQHKPLGHHNTDGIRVRQAIIETPAEAPVEAPPASRVVETRDLLAKKLTVDEAITQLQLLDNNFVVFTNAETGHVAVLYKRDGDSSFGLIDAVPSR